MSALETVRNTTRASMEAKPLEMTPGVAAETVIYQGSIVALNGGYAVAGEAIVDTGLLAIGCAQDTADNSTGDDGDVTVRVHRGVFRFDNYGDDEIDIEDKGLLCYIVDDHTVGKTNGGDTRSIAGVIYDVDSKGVWVEMGLAPAVDGTSLETEIAAREQLISDLASTATNKGASLVGIEDAASAITAATVEGALAELAALKIQKRTVTVTHATLTDDNDGEAQAVNIGATLPANSRILGVEMRALTPFTGGSVSSVTVDVGTSGDTDALIAGADLLSAAVDGGPADMPQGLRPNKTFVSGGAQLIATFTPDGGHDLEDLTAGSVIIDVLFATLA